MQVLGHQCDKTVKKVTNFSSEFLLFHTAPVLSTQTQWNNRSPSHS